MVGGWKTIFVCLVWPPIDMNVPESNSLDPNPLCYERGTYVKCIFSFLIWLSYTTHAIPDYSVLHTKYYPYMYNHVTNLKLLPFTNISIFTSWGLLG